MASEEKVVRLTYKQLSTLSEKYAQDDRHRPDNRAQGGGHSPREKDDRDDRAARRSKRPDRQIYQPGRTRLNQKRPEGEDPDDPGGPSDQVNNIQHQGEPELSDKNNDEGLTSQTSQSSLTGSSSDNDSSSKRRPKRSEMQRYVPKIKLDHQENQLQQQPQQLPGQQPQQQPQQNQSKQPDENVPDNSQEADSASSHNESNNQAPGSPLRKVDIHNMVITVHNEGDSSSPGRVRKGKGAEHKPGTKQDPGSRRGKATHSRNLTGGTDNLSDASDDSLEWDYASVDAELSSLDLGSPDEFSNPPKPLQNSAAAIANSGMVQLQEQHQQQHWAPPQQQRQHQQPEGRPERQGAGRQNSDGGGRRRRRDNRRNRNHPEADTHRVESGMDIDGDGQPVQGGRHSSGSTQGEEKQLQQVHKQPLQHRESQPQPLMQRDPQPQPLMQREPQPQPLMQREPQPQPLMQREPQPQPLMQRERQPHPLSQREPQSHPLSQKEPQPHPLPQREPQPLAQREPQPQPLPQREPQPQRQRQRRAGKGEGRQEDHGEDNRTGRSHKDGTDNQRGGRGKEQDPSVYTNNRSSESDQLNTPQTQRRQRQEREGQSRKGKQDSRKGQNKDDRLDPQHMGTLSDQSNKDHPNNRQKGHSEGGDREERQHNQRGGNRRAAGRQDSSGSEEHRPRADSREDWPKKNQNRLDDKQNRDFNQRKDGQQQQHPQPGRGNQQQPHPLQQQQQQQPGRGNQQQPQQQQPQQGRGNQQQQHPLLQQQQQQPGRGNQQQQPGHGNQQQQQGRGNQQQQQGRGNVRHGSGGESGARNSEGKSSRRRDRRGRGKGDTPDDTTPWRDTDKDSTVPVKKRENSVSAEDDECEVADEEATDLGKNVARDGKKPSLKVTFVPVHNERQVKMANNRGGRGEVHRPDAAGAHSPGHGGPPHGWTGSQGGPGGIIRLPVQQQPQQPQQQQQQADPAHHPHTPPGPPSTGGPGLIHSPPHPIWIPGAQGQQGPGGPRGRSSRGRGSHRTLYDPNNPNKSGAAMSSSPQQLHFQDSYDMQKGYVDTYSAPAFTPPHGEYYHQYPQQGGFQPGTFYDYGEYSSSPQQAGDTSYNYPPQYFESGAYPDNSHEDPYYHTGHDQELGGRSRASNRAKAESLLRDVAPLDNQLGNLLSRRIHGEEGMQKVLSLRREVQVKYGQVVLLDPDLANKHSTEQALWKAAFYQVIEVLRRHIADDQTGEAEKQAAKEHLLALLDEGTSFYEGTLKNLQNTYGFQLEDFLDPNQLTPEALSRQVKLALLSAQRTMICLGDIARYREQTNHTTNYGKARSWYLKAQQIAPKNGRPYNQLAILALYTRRKLDAVYYYMRSLAASNPFLTARESLMSLFDEARKKAEVTERKKQEERHQQQQEEILKSRDGNRIEIWVRADGTSSYGDDRDSDDLTKLTSIELNKRFVLSFLNVHGKLFTKIGRDTFPEASSQMLYEFDMLLQQSPPPIGNQRLLQLMTVNMYAIENTAPEAGTVDDNCRSLVQEQAVQVGLEMFGLLVRRSRVLLRQHLDSSDCQVLNEDLHQLIPSIKVWADWMTCHAALWNPPPHSRDPALGPVIDPWSGLAELCNVLKEVDITHVKLYAMRKEGCDPVILSEDTMLAGFVPLLSLPQIPMYVHCTVDKEVAKDCLRVDKLRTFGDYLCGIEPPLLSYNVETHRYVSIHHQDAVLMDTDGGLDSSREDDVIIESEEEYIVEGSPEEPGHIKQLRARRDRLQQQMVEHERQRHNRHALLNSDNSVRPIELEIRPLFIVPDTNGFIDHLNGLRKLVESNRFTMVLPLVVINELDGLARGSRDVRPTEHGAAHAAHAAHAAMVTSHAQTAVAFVEKQFEARNPRVRALTSKGSTLDTIIFRSEETIEGGNNDDLILSCCLYYCKDKARDFMPQDKDTAIRLRREVVLLTDDRNLRLKAHTRNVPVRDIPAFLKWAKVS